MPLLADSSHWPLPLLKDVLPISSAVKSPEAFLGSGPFLQCTGSCCELSMAINYFGNDFRYGTAALTCLLNFWAILPKSCRKSLSWHVLSLTHNIPQPIQPCCLMTSRSQKVWPHFLSKCCYLNFRFYFNSVALVISKLPKTRLIKWIN